MEIVYICPYAESSIVKERGLQGSFSPAANNKIFGIVKSLIKNKQNVTIISPALNRGNNFKLFKEKASCLEQYKDVEILYSTCMGFKPLKKIISIFSSVRKIKELIKKGKCQKIIYYNLYLETFIPALIANKLFKVPIFMEYEDSLLFNEDSNFLKKIMFSLLQRTAFSNNKGYILVNSIIAEQIPSNNYVVCRGFINDEIYENIDKKEKNEIPVVMYSGKFDTVRGINIFIQSLKYVTNPIHVVISGYGNTEHVKKEMKLIAQQNHCITYDIYEMVEKEKLYNLLINADILVNPQLINNIFSKYSFPSKVYEYLSTCNLIISSNMSDIEKIADGRIILYGKDDPQVLGQCIDEVVENYTDYSQMKVNIQKYIENECNIKKIGEKIVNLLEN